MRMREKRSGTLFIDNGSDEAGHSYALAKAVSGALARRRSRYRIFRLSGLDTSMG